MRDFIIPEGLRVGTFEIVGFTDGYSDNLVGLFVERADGIRVVVYVGENDGANVGLTEKRTTTYH